MGQNPARGKAWRRANDPNGAPQLHFCFGRETKTADPFQVRILKDRNLALVFCPSLFRADQGQVGGFGSPLARRDILTPRPTVEKERKLRLLSLFFMVTNPKYKSGEWP